MLVSATQMSTKVAARLGGKLSDVDSSRLQGSRTTVIIIGLINLMVGSYLNQHSVMDMIRHMAIGTMITAQHVLILIPEIRYGDITRRPEIHRQSNDGRPPSDLYNYDHYSERMINDHTNCGHYTKPYCGPFRESKLQPKTKQWHSFHLCFIQKITEIYEPSDYVDSSISSTNIALCSINVCGLNSNLKYKTLQKYINNIDIICLTETKCNKILDNEIKGYKYFVMHRKSTQHKYGGGGCTEYVYL